MNKRHPPIRWCGDNKVMIDGEPEAGAWSCGMVAGLVSDIPTVQELIDRIMSEAEDIIASKLQKAI